MTIVKSGYFRSKPTGLKISMVQNLEFTQLDEINEIEVGKRIKCSRLLRGDESYLRDHFPMFPVMPGVIIFEAMFQACSWLLRYSNDFTDTIVEVRQARNVKFQDFVEPEMQLTVEAEIIKQEGTLYTMKVSGSNGESTAVSARLVLDCYSVGDRDKSLDYVDQDCRKRYRIQFEQLYQVGRTE
jgi:3-hydroxyacyl-[acyl-carrier-protein] dehydratase